MDNENTTKSEPQVAPVASDQPSSRPVTPADELFAYINSHPEERLWEAIRNWSGCDYILLGNLTNRRGGKDYATIDSMKIYVYDTFQFGGRDS